MVSRAFVDDDPTGPQSCAHATVALSWSGNSLRDSMATGPTFLLTNSRALSPSGAKAKTKSAAAAAWKSGAATVAMRGDSTLRAHLFEEFSGWVEASGKPAPPLVLVPALPAAGRITVGGIHYLKRDGRLTRLDETEYSRDPRFQYSTSRLVDWASERSHGYFKASASREVWLDALRVSQGRDLEAAIGELAGSSVPAVCVPDAEVIEDLELIASALHRAATNGVPFAIRCGPAFAAVLSGTYTNHLVGVPSVGEPILVVCGSFVPNSTIQIDALVRNFPDSAVEVEPDTLLADGEEVIDSLARRVDHLLAHSPLAVLLTSRNYASRAKSAASSLVLATRLALIVNRLRTVPNMVIGKGGVTSALLASRGLGARRARVVGPLAPGIALWELESPRRAMPFVVFPGNVGERASLVDLVDAMLSKGSDARDTQ